MFTQRAARFLAAVLAAWPAMGATGADAGVVGSIEGAWVAVAKTPAGDIRFLQTFTPMSLDPMQLVATMEQVNENPTYFGAFPDADRASHWAGHATYTGPTSVECSFISYLTRPARSGSASPAETLAILVLHGRWELTGADSWTGDIVIAAYRADQDADGDGLPDDGQSPVDCSTFPCTGKRLGRLPRCEVVQQEIIETVVGQEFTISLPSNPTTGYSWALAGSLPDGLLLVGSQYKPSQPDPNVVGSGGVEEWTFKATKAGTATLTFEYRRPWEKELPPAQRKVFVVKARPASDTADLYRTIETQPGSALKIGMEANPSTGYEWQMVSTLPAWLDLIEHEFRAGPCPPPYVGCEGVEEWTFDVKGQGQAVLVFEYRRAWEKDRPPLRRLTCSVLSQ
jgi:inhibitor of cysteine peptidase